MRIRKKVVDFGSSNTPKYKLVQMCVCVRRIPSNHTKHVLCLKKINFQLSFLVFIHSNILLHLPEQLHLPLCIQFR